MGGGLVYTKWCVWVPPNYLIRDGPELLDVPAGRVERDNVVWFVSGPNHRKDGPLREILKTKL